MMYMAVHLTVSDHMKQAVQSSWWSRTLYEYVYIVVCHAFVQAIAGEPQLAAFSAQLPLPSGPCQATSDACKLRSTVHSSCRHRRIPPLIGQGQPGNVGEGDPGIARHTIVEEDHQQTGPLRHAGHQHWVPFLGPVRCCKDRTP